MKPFRIFRPGKHTASNGVQVEFTEAQLQDAVGHYNAKVYAAPLVIGHPKSEDRAYGWAETLTYEDGYVVAHPERVDPQFAELVEKGAYRNRSASWYLPDHPNNPVPGSLYPRHIGFLGAVPPALKGLGDVQFAEELHPELVVEFADSDSAWSMASFMSNTASILRGLRDALLAGTAGNGTDDADARAATADKLVPSYLIDDMAREAVRQQERASQATSVSPSFTEPEDPTMTLTPEQIAQLQADKAAADAKLAEYAERETALAASERQATVAGIERDLAPLVQAGKILPAQVKGLADFMAGLDDKDQTVEFGEAKDGVVPKVSRRGFMKGFLATLPKAVDFSERGNVTSTNSGAMTPTELANRATALRTKVKADTGRDISFSEATNRVLQETGIAVADPTNAPNV